MSRYEYVVIGGPLDGKYVNQDDFRCLMSKTSSGKYDGYRDEYVQYNAASRPRHLTKAEKEAGVQQPTSAVWIHKSLVIGGKRVRKET